MKLREAIARYASELRAGLKDLLWTTTIRVVPDLLLVVVVSVVCFAALVIRVCWAI
jgi:preprotein translocase subunit SecE